MYARSRSFVVYAIASRRCPSCALCPHPPALLVKLRASVHYFNNEEDLDKTIAALRGVIAGARAGIH